RLRQIDPAPVDRVAALGEQTLEIEVGHRSVQAILLASPYLDLDHDPVDLVGDATRGLALALALVGDESLLVLEDGEVAPARLGRQTAWQEVVAPVSGFDLDPLTHRAEIRYVFAQNDFHRMLARSGTHEREWQQGGVSRLLDRAREPPLVARAVAGDATRNDLAAFADEARENAVLLVIDGQGLLGAEAAH